MYGVYRVDERKCNITNFDSVVGRVGILYLALLIIHTIYYFDGGGGGGGDDADMLKLKLDMLGTFIPGGI